MKNQTTPYNPFNGITSKAEAIKHLDDLKGENLNQYISALMDAKKKEFIGEDDISIILKELKLACEKLGVTAIIKYIPPHKLEMKLQYERH